VSGPALSKTNYWDAARDAFGRWHAGRPTPDDRRDQSWLAGYVSALTDHDRPAPETDGYRDAFYAISELLGLPAMPISPKEAFETVMLPQLRRLLGSETSRLYPHWHCDTHGDFDARVAVGCPECVREMRKYISEYPMDTSTNGPTITSTNGKPPSDETSLADSTEMCEHNVVNTSEVRDRSYGRCWCATCGKTMPWRYGSDGVRRSENGIP
jgi:hypothetical protein